MQERGTSTAKPSGVKTKGRANDTGRPRKQKGRSSIIHYSKQKKKKVEKDVMRDMLPTCHSCIRTGPRLAVGHGDGGRSRLHVPMFNMLLGILFRVCCLWYPAYRRAWCRLLEHPVDLLERETLGLGYQEVRVNKGACAEGTLYDVSIGHQRMGQRNGRRTQMKKTDERRLPASTLTM